MAGNPFYATPGMAQAASSLAQAFMPNPEREATSLARQAQSRLYDTQSEEIAARLAANPRAAEALRRGDLAGAYAAWAEGGSAPVMQAAPGFVRGYGAASGVSRERLSDLFVGAGGSEANSPRGFDATLGETRRNHDMQSGDRRYSVDQSRAGAMEREQLQEQGRNNRTGVELNNNTDFVVGPNHPLAGQATDGRIQGPRVETGAGARPARISNVPTSVSRSFQTFFGGPVTLRDGKNYAFDGPAQRHLAARASDLWQAGPEGVRGNADRAMEEALIEFEKMSPPRVDSQWWGFSDRRFGMPQAQGGGAAAGGATQPKPGDRVRQNGVEYIIQPDGTARPAS